MSNNVVSVKIIGGPTVSVPWTEGMSGQSAIEAA
jgi:hypothetical protein